MPAADPAVEMLPTDERLARLKKGQEDPGLSALYFQFGRYLLMGSSRPGTMAANLQGIWNEQMAPPWDSKYTTNINVEMNYWPAEVGNLAETTGPLFDLVKMYLESGRKHCQGDVRRARLRVPSQPRRLGRYALRSTTPTAASGRWAARGWRCISGSTISTAWIARS